MERLVLENVFFKAKIEDVFTIRIKSIVVTGQVECGQIHDKSDVVITDATGLVLKKTKVKDLEWLSRGRWEHVTAVEGMNIGIVFDTADKEYLQIGHYIVIE